MFAPDQYLLLDFGDGRRLERFGPLVLDRPCPAAEGVPKGDPAVWGQADARFVRTKQKQRKEGEWVLAHPLPERWTIRHGPLALELKRTEFGHLGVFPEQAANWDWLGGQLRRGPVAREYAALSARLHETHQFPRPSDPPPLKLLNLFAYTGASTLAAAAAGAEVVHVDAARNVVDWARRNAELSGLAGAPVRWIAEDAMKFVKRELKRGSRYDAVVLDPPSYGHGPRGEVWRLSKHLKRLLAMCGELTAGRRRFVLLTCHTPKFGPERLARLMRDTLGEAQITAGLMILRTPGGRQLASGAVVRWSTS